MRTDPVSSFLCFQYILYIWWPVQEQESLSQYYFLPTKITWRCKKGQGDNICILPCSPTLFIFFFFTQCTCFQYFLLMEHMRESCVVHYIYSSAVILLFIIKPVMCPYEEEGTLLSQVSTAPLKHLIIHTLHSDSLAWGPICPIVTWSFKWW